MFTSFDDLAPLLRTLREHAAAGSDSTTYRGTVSPGSFTGRVVDHPTTIRAAGHDPRTTALFDLGSRLPAGSALYLDLTAGRDGTATASGALLDSSVETGAGRPIATVLLSDALPPPFRGPRAQPEQGPPDGPSDPDLVSRLMAAGAPGAKPAGPAELAALEARSGPLPADLRALYETVGAGPIEPGDDTGEAFFGMDVIGIDDAQRTMYDASHRNPGWQFATLMMIEPDPAGRVRLFGGTDPSTWVPFADDGGGNQYCVDLAPGPQGHRGQVVLVHHEDTVGAAWVAPSISSFLTGPPADAPRPQESPLRLVRVPTPANGTGRLAARFRRRSPFEAITDAVEVVTLPPGAELDLAPLTRRPRLWSLSAPPGSVRDLGDLHRLPTLEHLTLAPTDWRTLIDGPGLPPGLIAAGIAGHDHTDADELDVADAILRCAGRPALQRFAVSGSVT